MSRSPPADYFPDFQSGDDYDAACDYLLKRFNGLNQSSSKQICAHYTSATDTQQIKCMFVPRPPSHVVLIVAPSSRPQRCSGHLAPATSPGMWASIDRRVHLFL